MTCCFQYKHHVIQRYLHINLLERPAGVQTYKKDIYVRIPGPENSKNLVHVGPNTKKRIQGAI